MADLQIDGMTSKATPVGTDQLEIQESAGGLTKKITLQGIWDNQPKYLVFSLVDAATSVVVGTSIGGDFTIPLAGTIQQDDALHDQLCATTDTAGTTGTMTVDIHLNGTTIMTTNKLSIATTEKGSQTNATQPDLTTTAVVAGDILTFDVDAIHTTAAKGLKIYIMIV